MFYTTDISVTLWIMNNNKKARMLNGRQLRDRTGEVLFVDLRRWDENTEEYVIDKGKKKKKTVLTDSQIAAVKKIYNDWQSVETVDSSTYAVPELYRSVKIDEIGKKDYCLAPSKYIEFIDHDLDIDFNSEMARIQSEMRNLMEQEQQSQKMLVDAFEGIGYGIKKVKLGDLLELCDERNSDLKYDLSYVRGISTKKEFIITKADMTGVKLDNYKIVFPGEIAYVSDTSRRGDKISLAINRNSFPILVSTISTVFKTNSSVLLSDYIMLYFSRAEFDRYSRFNSWGSARETFSWQEMCDIDIELPPIDVQKST